MIELLRAFLLRKSIAKGHCSLSGGMACPLSSESETAYMRKLS